MQASSVLLRLRFKKNELLYEGWSKRCIGENLTSERKNSDPGFRANEVLPVTKRGRVRKAFRFPDPLFAITIPILLLAPLGDHDRAYHCQGGQGEGEGRGFGHNY